MATRKDNEENRPPNHADDGDAEEHHLPVHRPQSRALLEAPRKGLVVVVERGADAYFSTCRRIAQFLNRGS